jgi:hypothetical protein
VSKTSCENKKLSKAHDQHRAKKKTFQKRTIIIVRKNNFLKAHDAKLKIRIACKQRAEKKNIKKRTMLPAVTRTVKHTAPPKIKEIGCLKWQPW